MIYKTTLDIEAAFKEFIHDKYNFWDIKAEGFINGVLACMNGIPRIMCPYKGPITHLPEDLWHYWNLGYYMRERYIWALKCG